MEAVSRSQENSTRKRRARRHVTDRKKVAIGSSLTHLRRIRKLDKHYLAPLKLPFNSFLNRDFHLVLKIYPFFLKYLCEDQAKGENHTFYGIKNYLSLKDFFDTVKCFTDGEVIYYIKFQSSDKTPTNFPKNCGEHCGQELMNVLQSNDLCIFPLESFVIIGNIIWPMNTILNPDKIVHQPFINENDPIKLTENRKSISVEEKKLKNDALLDYMNQINQKCSSSNRIEDSYRDRDYSINHIASQKFYSRQAGYSLVPLLESSAINFIKLKLDKNDRAYLSKLLFNTTRSDANCNTHAFQNIYSRENFSLFAKQLYLSMNKSNNLLPTLDSRCKLQEAKKIHDIFNKNMKEYQTLQQIKFSAVVNKEPFLRRILPKRASLLSHLDHKHCPNFIYKKKSLSDSKLFKNCSKKYSNSHIQTIENVVSDGEHLHLNVTDTSAANTFSYVKSELCTSLEYNLSVNKSLCNLQQNVLGIENKLLTFHESICTLKEEINRLLIQNNLAQSNQTSIIEKMNHEIKDSQINPTDFKELKERLGKLECTLQRSEERLRSSCRNNESTDDYNKSLISYVLSASFLIGFMCGDIVKW